MSAYVVSPTHIDAMLSVALNGTTEPRAPWIKWSAPYVFDGEQPEQLSPANADRVGSMLLAECIESVAYRYPRDDRSSLPGPIPTPDPEQYELTDLGRAFSLAEALQMISGYEYQACEHPGWRESEAFRFCADLRSALVSRLRGEVDTWEVTVEQAMERLGVKA